MFQKSQQLSCIDLIFTNKPNLFQHSTVFETGLSDFPLLTVTKFKKHKTFDNEKFRSDILKHFDKNDFGSYKDTLANLFNKNVPLKNKYVRANEAPFMINHLRKENMKRSRLRNIFLKDKSELTKKTTKLKGTFSKNFSKPLKIIP